MPDNKDLSGAHARVEAQINKSRLLSPEARQAWLAQLPNLDEAHCARLVKALGEESRFLKKELREALKRALVQGDSATVEAFKQTLATLTRGTGRAEEKQSTAEESETLKNLESDLNAL